MEDTSFFTEIPLSDVAVTALSSMDSAAIVYDKETSPPVEIDPKKKYRGYVPWGDSNLRPNEVLALQRVDDVLSANRFFNILSGVGNGLTYTKPTGEKVDDKEVLNFFKYHRSARYLLEQVTDMKHFFFTVSVLILSGDGKKIVGLRHKDATYCRFETCNPTTGVIEHVFFANWEVTPKFEDVEVIELLDINNPLGDLEVRMGLIPGEDGKMKKPTEVRKFAMVNSIPIPGNKYYPFPYSWSIFNSGWYDIKQMIVAGKKAKFKNGLVIRYHVEINKEYWPMLYQAEGITDPALQRKRMTKEKENIRDFLSGMANAGKAWFSGFYQTPDGKEVSMIRINVVSNTKEGGDWLDDAEEANNVECYADGIHPNLIGATPGKSGNSMSGSDKRELFTIKQALEAPIRNLLLEPYFVLINYNGWEEKVKVEIPFVMLTTLDQNKDAKTVTNNSTNTPK